MNRKQQLIVAAVIFLASIYIFELLVPHILYVVGSRSLFLLEFDYIFDQILSVGGVSRVLGDFVLQFAHIKFLGSIIISLFIAPTYYILTTLNNLSYSKERWDYLSLIAIVPLYILSSSSSVDFSIYYIIAAFFSSLLLSLINRFRSLFVAITLTIFGYYFAGGVAVLLPIVVLIFYKEIKVRYLPIAVFALLPLIDAFVNLEFITVSYKRVMSYDVLIFVVTIVLSLLLTRYLPTIKKSLQWVIFAISVLVMIFVSSYKFVKSYSYQEKLMIMMERSMNEADYNSLLEWADRYPSNNLLKSYSTNLALLATDRLSYEVLNYPQQFGLDGLAMGSRGGQRKNDYAHHIYAELGMYNEAHRLVWESATINRFNRINLKQLAHYNQMIGREKVAQKYEKIASKTIFNNNLVTLPTTDKIESDTLVARFTNPYNICVDLIYLASKTTLTQQQSDCLMVGLLLSNRVLEFSKYTKYLSLYYSDKPMPTLYDEALAMLKAALSSEEFLQLGIEPTIVSQKRYSDYAQKNQEVKGNGAALKSFNRSYFYYINFLSPYGSKVITQ